MMQVMPETYAELRLRYHLGTDPYEPRNNILAGAAYYPALYSRRRKGTKGPAFWRWQCRRHSRRDHGIRKPPEFECLHALGGNAA